MSSTLAILVPVLNRPHRVEPLLANLRETTPDARVLFIADPDDTSEKVALKSAGADWIAPGGTYASKINTGVCATREPLIFAGADDLVFHPGWLEHAVAAFARGASVVGVNDLIVRTREHATHFLMTREYAELPLLDGSPGPFSEAYHHWYCDDELTGTAVSRGVYAYARDAIVEHIHPYARRDDGSRKAAWDQTYELGRARKRHDRLTFRDRSRMWT